MALLMPKHVEVLIIIVNYILLRALFGRCVDCKNMRGVNNNTELLLLLSSSTQNKNGT